MPSEELMRLEHHLRQKGDQVTLSNSRSCCDRPAPPALLKAVTQFNQREFFECHETLEMLWNLERRVIYHSSGTASPSTGNVPYCDNLYKGILQVGVGCYHLLRGNYHGAVTKLASGARYLEPFAPVCQGVRVGQLIADARRLHSHLTALGRARIAEADLSLIPRLTLEDKP
jgi:uncharacterized protein